MRNDAGDAPRPFLFGLPQAIKDMVPTAGIRSTSGSPLFKDFVPAADSLLVQRMKAAGCIVIGKTNTPEFGLGSHTFNEVFGATRNAFDPTRSAGGSSGGAAVALAHAHAAGRRRQRLRWAACATRRPGTTSSAFARARAGCRTGRRTDVWVTHFGTEGPMARNVRDLALLLDVQAGYDARVPLSLADRAVVRGARWSERRRRTRRCASAGSATSTATWRWKPASSTSATPACAGSRRRLPRRARRALGFAPERLWDAWLMWRRWLVDGRISPHLAEPANRALIKPEALWEHDHGARLSGAQMMEASVERSAFYQQMLTLFERFDFLALPTTQVWPFSGRVALAEGDRRPDDGHLPPLDGGGDATPPSPACRASACRSASTPPACRWACS